MFLGHENYRRTGRRLGIDQIIRLIDHMKQLAIDVANDSDTDEDRRTIQKEFDSRMATINDIAIGTEYNGKRLLDGTWARKSSGGKTVIPLDAVEYTIDNDGTYVLPIGYTGTLTVNAQNVKITQEDPSTLLFDVTILAPEGSNANMWIKDLNLDNSTRENDSTIKFRGTGNVLTFEGTNTFTQGRVNPTQNFNAATINVVGGLTLEGDGSLSIRNVGNATCSGIGVDQDYFNPSTNITINSGTYDIWINDDGAAIGGSVNSTIGDIIINGGNISVRSVSGAGIGTGTGRSFVQSIKLHVDANIIANSLHGEDIGRGVTGILGNEVEYFDDGDDMSAYGLTTSTSELYDGNPLWIQHGTQSGQRIHVYINSMRTEALKGTIPNKADKAQLAALDYDSAKQAELQAILNAAKNMTLDDAKVTTVDNAKIAIRVVEGALEYALNEATTQGAYLQRLEFTDSNVTIMGENVQQAESTIRDADMAREMAEYTKYNILTQSSQAMLAQANQNQSSILSLLQ